jgi:hypothetical protein
VPTSYLIESESSPLLYHQGPEYSKNMDIGARPFACVRALARNVHSLCAMYEEAVGWQPNLTQLLFR